MNAEQTKFFVTSQGLPGMGPRDVQSGDEIYAIAGCKSLVVLRPSLGKGQQQPTVVGLCFVDRWMYGRALQREAVWKTMTLYSIQDQDQRAIAPLTLSTSNDKRRKHARHV